MKINEGEKVKVKVEMEAPKLNVEKWIEKECKRNREVKSKRREGSEHK